MLLSYNNWKVIPRQLFPRLALFFSECVSTVLPPAALSVFLSHNIPAYLITS